MLAMDGDTR
jgi:Dynamin central region